MPQGLARALPLLIAHRGGKFWESTTFSYIPESIRNGADIIELDVRIRDGRYVVQHGHCGTTQGHLDFAISTLSENVALYLDVKDDNLDVNALTAHVRSRCCNPLIIGSFKLRLLQGIEDPTVERNLHCWWPGPDLDRQISNVNWVNPLCYFVTHRVASDIQTAGFRFVPSGNPVFKRNEIMNNQLQYAKWGAYAISTHHVKEMKAYLTSRL